MTFCLFYKYVAFRPPEDYCNIHSSQKLIFYNKNTKSYQRPLNASESMEYILNRLDIFKKTFFYYIIRIQGDDFNE